MRRLARTCIFVGLAAQAAGQGWEMISAEAAGLDAVRLEEVRADLAARKTAALVVVRRGKIALEWYAPGFGPDRQHFTASLAKAIVGGLSLALALEDGRMRVDDRAVEYIPEWRGDARRERITIRHLATHTSGVQDAEQDGIPHEKLPGWMGSFWRREPDPFTIALRDAPVVFEPGKAYQYSNPGMAALAVAVTRSLGGGPAGDLEAYLRERIYRRVGIADAEWRVGYGKAYQVGGLRLFANWGGGSFTPRAVARLGLLMLQRGRWANAQVLKREWARRVVEDAGLPGPESTAENFGPRSGLCWWVNPHGGWKDVPRDAFAGAGAGHQLLLVVPSLDLVVVRQGAALEQDGRREFWKPAVERVFAPIVGAVRDKGPYPLSGTISRVRFAGVETIRRAAMGSDNWPLTWGDDGLLYTAYGDGWGFEPRTERKLSQGFACIEGGPSDFRGFNIRTATGETTGDGRAGPKASGMVMVDGVLYAWVRNTGNAQLVWSGDRGRTWEWGFKLDTSFGSPAFLNFGRNYEGARDDFVYTYSQDGDSAYEPDDGLVLVRVPRKRLRDRGAWEFFETLDAGGQPVWTRDIGRRGPVFRNPGRCERVDAVYHPGLRRYLLAIGESHTGEWGLYEAGEPWGEWRGVEMEGWDLKGTHGYRLPAKWLDPAGRRLVVVFSGVGENDAFCVREASVELKGNAVDVKKERRRR